MERRKQITYILDSSTENLCNNLQPQNILQRLKTRQVLSGDDIREITSSPRLDDQVDRLLEMLKRRPPTAFEEFMSALSEFRPDLFQDLQVIEYTYHGSTSSSAYMQRAYPPPRAPQQQPVGPHHSADQQRPVGAHYVPSGASYQATPSNTSTPASTSTSTRPLPDTFPADLSERINNICGNNNTGSQPRCAAGTPQGAGSLNFDSPQHGEPSIANISPSGVDIPDRETIPTYPLTRDPRGLAVIISNEEFVQKEPHSFEFREGADRDAGNLIRLFISLKFKVLCRNNLTRKQMHDILDEIRRYDHTQFDCFICCILTHGQLNEVFGSDSLAIPIQELTGLFNGFKCESLRGKPKLFFIQACQGNVRQPGVTQPARDNPAANAQAIVNTIPIENDYLVGFSTLPGYASYRCPIQGSWYIISLVQYIRKYHDRVDMANMLALVNGHVSRCSDNEGFKQSCPYKSTLTKYLYL